MDIIQSQNSLALGTDLTSFGLNLNTTDNLFASFTSPFNDSQLESSNNLSTTGASNPSAIFAHSGLTFSQICPPPPIKLPYCYTMHFPVLKEENFSKFNDEILFYIFYHIPNEILQGQAGLHLCKKNWKYVIGRKFWIKNTSDEKNEQNTNNSSKSSTPSYVFWDTEKWKEMPLPLEILSHKQLPFATEEDFRVKYTE